MSDNRGVERVKSRWEVNVRRDRRRQLLLAITRGRIRVQDFARSQGVSLRTAYRDVARLRRDGYVIASAPGPRGGIWLSTRSCAAPIEPTLEQLRPVAVHLKATGARPELWSALLDGLPPQSRQRLQRLLSATRAASIPALEARLLARIEGAVDDQWPLVMQAGISRRVVPRALELRASRWVLKGELVRTGESAAFPLDEQDDIRRASRPWGPPLRGSRRVRPRRPDDPPPPDHRHPVQACHLPPWATGWVDSRDP